MKSTQSVIAGLICFLNVSFLPAPRVTAQSTSGSSQIASQTALSATIDIGSGTSLEPPERNNRFERVGLNPGQVANITLQFPVVMAGQPISAEALDGGQIIFAGSALTVGSDGTLSFQFDPGTAVGTRQWRYGQF
jgi:hypothetical protein